LDRRKTTVALDAMVMRIVIRIAIWEGTPEIALRKSLICLKGITNVQPKEITCSFVAVLAEVAMNRLGLRTMMH